MTTTVRAILTVAETAAADAAAKASIQDLIERAGRAVARVVAERFERSPVLVLAGPGNNGADGYVAARVLREAGWPVRVAALGTPKGDAAHAAAAWADKTEPLDTLIAPGELVIDALFGAGLDRPLPADVTRLARRLQSKRSRVIAVDVPSGLIGDTGKAAADGVFHAALTVTFHRKKPAHVLQPGRGFCGEVVVADIGLAPPLSPRLFENGPDVWASKFPWPSIDAYKMTRGRLVVVSGDAWSTGAARLSSRAALRVGAGLVTLLSPPEALMVNAAHLEAVMLKPFETEVELEAIASNVEVAVIGPAAGVTEATLSNVLALARTGAALVIDADALSVFRDEPGELFSALDRDDVLTPHPGEFERIFPGLLKSAPDRISAVRMAVARAQAVILLKGADTVICAPDGRTAVNVNGSPWLATAGSGDVLAGLIGGLIAQGMDSFEAACAGAWIHAECAEAFGPGLISEDLPGLVPMVLKRLWERVAPRNRVSG